MDGKTHATPRDNMLSMLRRQGYEWVPLSMELCPAQLDTLERVAGHRDVEQFFGLSHRTVRVPMKTAYSDGRALYRREALPPDTRIDGWGIGHSKGSEHAVHMTRMHHPLKGAESVDEIADYPMPIPTRSEEVIARVKELHEEGLAVIGDMACTIWEVSWYLRSMEELMTDMMMEDPKAIALLDRVTATAATRAALYAEAGVDILHLGDDIGTQQGPMMSVEMWREWLAPRLTEVIRSARRIKPDLLVSYHSCGNVTAFVDGLIEAGVDILNPIQPECMSFDDICRRYGDRLSFWGTIGTQKTLPFGSPEAVKKEVRARLRCCGERGGIMVGPTHLVEPEVPWENLIALREAAEEFGANPLTKDHL